MEKNPAFRAFTENAIKTGDTMETLEDKIFRMTLRVWDDNNIENLNIMIAIEVIFNPGVPEQVQCIMTEDTELDVITRITARNNDYTRTMARQVVRLIEQLAKATILDLELVSEIA